VTGNTWPEAEQLVASAVGAEEATSNPKRSKGACNSARRLELSVGTGGNGCNNTGSNLEKAVNFAECMRNKGRKDFPDPPADGFLIDMSRIRSAVGSGARSMPGFRAAADRCTALCSSALELQGK
jgi:hypothetical protein